MLVKTQPFRHSFKDTRELASVPDGSLEWISYATTENLEFNESSWYLIFSLVVLTCMSDNVLKLVEVISSGNKLFVTSESERVNENFGVQEKSI